MQSRHGAVDAQLRQMATQVIYVVSLQYVLFSSSLPSSLSSPFLSSDSLITFHSLASLVDVVDRDVII